MSISDKILSHLNSSQRAAVSSSAPTLAILAGPGSGKTHTLTSRTAWLLEHEGLQPWNIIVATFTVKAAKEMKERIGKLIGDGMASKLILGTFHSIARRYLARYGHLINIQKDFGIADRADSLAIIKRVVKRHKLTIDPPAAQSRISSRKAKGGQSINVQNAHQSAQKRLEIQEFDTCYREYEEALKRSNLLDYDDLLLRCVELLRIYPSCVSNVEAVLIDEFQDTNIVQFDLMRLFAAQRRRVTIVGDPDQSIYGFRSAETKNFQRMLTQYPETITVPLEENYRSSGAILLSALEVIRQDEGRIAKSLLPTHIVGTRPVLRKLSSARTEAQWIVTEIKRILALTGDLMTFDDIAILLRSASLSRHIESSLGKAGIAYRMVGGFRFFDRSEIKILLDYLRVINLPDNNDALSRVVNVPSRRIGDITVKGLLEEAEQSRITLWKLVLDHAQGTRNTKTKLGKQTEQGLSSFVNIILTARKKMSDSGATFTIRDLLDLIINKLCFEDFLEKAHPEDYESRWANVQELVGQASDFTESMENGYEDEDVLPEVENWRQVGLSSPLSNFLANIALTSAIEASECDGPPKTEITISTIHAAKGLEWPVVFIPATYEGSIPHSRAEDTDEERRLLYVAMTRAKALLYMSHPTKNSQREQTTLSPFLTARSLMPHLDNKGPSFTYLVTQSVAHILQRPIPIVDIGSASCILESLEDDLFTTEGEEAEEIDFKSEEWTGEHHYTQGQRPPKRLRLDTRRPELASEKLAMSWKPSYSTTMAQPASFSTSSMTFTDGFVTAGAHMNVLSVQSGNSTSEMCQTSEICQAGFKVSDCDILLAGKNAISQETVTAQTIRRPRGQSSLMGFFAASGIVSSRVGQKMQSCSSMAPKNLDPSAKQKESTGCKPAQIRYSHSSPPTVCITDASCLGNHRLGSAYLAGPSSSRHEEPGVTNKPYVFLSSSPQAPESIVNDVEEPVLLDLNEPGPISLTKSTTCIRNQPAKTMHLTSMAKLSTIVPRKTLGVRRSVNGWPSRKNRAFAQPIVNRPP